MVGRSVGQKKNNIDHWKSLGSRESRAAKYESLVTSQLENVVLLFVIPYLFQENIQFVFQLTFAY